MSDTVTNTTTKISNTSDTPDKKMTTKFVEQNDHFKTNSDVANGISICIPRLFNNIGHLRVKGVFIKQNWGFVERVDVIHYGDHKKAFVHFSPGSWNWNTCNARILEQLQAGEQIHLRYENGKPWFWHVGISYVERPKKEDVNYFPAGVMNLNQSTQGDKLLKRKHENSNNNVNIQYPLIVPQYFGVPKYFGGAPSSNQETSGLTEEPVRDRDDPIKARILENNPKSSEGSLDDGELKEDQWRCNTCMVANSVSTTFCVACTANYRDEYYDPQTEDTFA